MSWTLTWDDINHFEEKVSDQLGKRIMKNTQTKKTIRKLPALKNLEGNFFETGNNLSRLIWLLENGHQNRAAWQGHFHSFLLGLQETFGAASLSEEHLQDYLRTGTPLDQYPQHRDPKGNNFLFAPIPAESDQFSFRLFVKMSDLALGGGVFPPGRLLRFDLVPVRRCRLRLQLADADETAWLHAVLARESASLATGIHAVDGPMPRLVVETESR